MDGEGREANGSEGESRERRRRQGREEGKRSWGKVGKAWGGASMRGYRGRWARIGRVAGGWEVLLKKGVEVGEWGAFASMLSTFCQHRPTDSNLTKSAASSSLNQKI